MWNEKQTLSCKRSELLNYHKSGDENTWQWSCTVITERGFLNELELCITRATQRWSSKSLLPGSHAGKCQRHFYLQAELITQIMLFLIKNQLRAKPRDFPFTLLSIASASSGKEETLKDPPSTRPCTHLPSKYSHKDTSRDIFLPGSGNSAFLFDVHLLFKSSALPIATL